jgi:rSAM/selenodomain-associated transferase 2
LMPTLRDVDVPEDLPVWQRIAEQEPRARSEARNEYSEIPRVSEQEKVPASVSPQLKPHLSILIPTKDFEPGLSVTLDSIQSKTKTDVEVIVAATGDTARTRALCGERRIQLVECPLNRGQQWNAAVRAANSDCLLLLHADTILPSGYAETIENCLRRPNIVAGAFQLQIDSPHAAARWIESGVKYRSLFRQFPYGDQAIFLRRETLEKVGGVPCQPIMEDFELIRRLRRLGRIAIADQRVITSARRWHQLGWLRTTFVNQVMIVGYYLGVPPSRLRSFYRRQQGVR